MITDQQLAAARRAELERRVAALSSTDATSSGRIRRREWVLLGLGTILVPLLVWLRFG